MENLFLTAVTRAENQTFFIDSLKTGSEIEFLTFSGTFFIKLTISTMTDIILWDFLIPYQILFPPQAKWSVIISNKHGIYDLPYKLPKT